MTVILSVDQSIGGNTGYAVHSDSTLIYSGYEDFKGYRTQSQRLKRFLFVFKKLRDRYNPNIAICELVHAFRPQKFANTSLASTILLAKTIGLMQVVLPEEVDLWMANTSTWKARVLGNGRSGKQASIDYVKTFYRKEVNDDEADAICIGKFLYDEIKMGGPVEVKNVLELAK